MLLQLYRGYNELWESGDPRVKDWPLMNTPLVTISICLVYVYTVKVAGPKFMRDRKPMEIRNLMIGYNFTMVIASFYLFYKLGVHGWFGKYNFKCQPVDYSGSLDAVGMLNAAYWYYISKFVEFFDTIFFVLRRKYGHISTLHVIHHGIMPMSVWWGVKFTPGGHSTFFAFLNSFIHIIMYTYYGIAAIGPHMHKYLWWKKYMTGAQMIQFMFIIVHSFQLLFRSCDYPRGFMWFIGFHGVMFFFLFWDFYKEEYHKKRQITTAGKDKQCDYNNNNKSQNTSTMSKSSASSIKSSSISSAISRLSQVCTPDTTKLIHNNNYKNNNDENCIYTKHEHNTSEHNSRNSNNNNNNTSSRNNNQYTNGFVKSAGGENGLNAIKNRSNCKDNNNFQECSLDSTSKNHQDRRKHK